VFIDLDARNIASACSSSFGVLTELIDETERVDLEEAVAWEPWGIVVGHVRGRAGIAVAWEPWATAAELAGGRSNCCVVARLGVERERPVDLAMRVAPACSLKHCRKRLGFVASFVSAYSTCAACITDWSGNANEWCSPVRWCTFVLNAVVPWPFPGKTLAAKAAVSKPP